MSLLHHVTTRRCDKCGEGKPLKGGMQLQKRIGARYAQTFVCWACIVLHHRKHATGSSSTATGEQ